MATGGSPPVDPKTVALEVQKGKSLEEIQRIFGIKLKSQVQDLYVRGLKQLGEIPQFEMPKAKYGESAKIVDTGYRRSIGQSGSITLTRSLLFEKLFEDLDKNGEASVIHQAFLKGMSENYRAKTPAAGMVRDFIAGMTDEFFMDQCHKHLIPVTTHSLL